MRRRTWISVLAVAVGAAVLPGAEPTRADASDAAPGQLSGAYQLAASGKIAPFRLAAGTKLSYKITSYNDQGQTASGYTAGLGKCAVDARFIPLGTRFQVAGYGYCYAAA